MGSSRISDEEARFYCCGEVCCGKKMCISGKLYVVKARQAPKTLPLRKKTCGLAERDVDVDFVARAGPAAVLVPG